MDATTPVLSFDSIMKMLEKTHISENRTDEFYAVAQLIAEGELTKRQQKVLGGKLVEIIERDHWWRSNGAFNDE